MPQNCFLQFQRKYHAIYEVKTSKISSSHFYTSLVQDLMVRYVKKLGLCNGNANFECFLLKKGPWDFRG